MGKKRGEAVVKGLLGGYGSSEDEGEGNDDQGSPKALDELGQYEGSGSEAEGGLGASGLGTRDAFGSDDEELDWGDYDPY